ncbi:hypothetical protein N7536_007958 [Penicillium majusculum]|nr:hypothetical protein N7536_007958 [Penicillium majusculum]
MGYDEASESDVEPSLQSRRSVPPNDDHQEKVKMETMSGTRQEGSPGSSTGCLTEIILPSPHSAPNPAEPLRKTWGSTRADTAGIRCRTIRGRREPQSKEDVARPQEEVPTAAEEIERNTPAKYPTAAHDDGHGVRASPAPVHCSKYLQIQMRPPKYRRGISGF